MSDPDKIVHLTSEQHYLEAERILHVLENSRASGLSNELAQLTLQKWQQATALAQVHATLATIPSGVSRPADEPHDEIDGTYEILGYDPEEFTGRPTGQGDL